MTELRALEVEDLMEILAIRIDRLRSLRTEVQNLSEQVALLAEEEQLKREEGLLTSPVYGQAARRKKIAKLSGKELPNIVTETNKLLSQLNWAA